MADARNDFDLSEEDDDLGEGTETSGSNPINELRKQLRAAQKRAKEAESKATEYDALLAKQAADARVQKVSTLFEEMGLNPAQAKLFSATSGDEEPTAEAVAKFALDYGLGVSPETAAAVEAAAQPPKFIPLSPGGSLPATNMISRADFNALKRTDPAAAARAVMDRRVEGFNYDAEVDVRIPRQG
jgi:hypothetical protein